MAQQTWIVTADSSASSATVAKELEAIGLTIVQVLDVIGTVEVQGSESLARKAAALPGVASVEKSLTFDVGPPDAEIS
jgi:HJR/Mrr/RecB family endonuclease